MRTILEVHAFNLLKRLPKGKENRSVNKVYRPEDLYAVSMMRGPCIASRGEREKEEKTFCPLFNLV